MGGGYLTGDVLLHPCLSLCRLSDLGGGGSL